LKKIHPLLLSLFSGLLLFAAWPVSPFTFLIFIAFVPLLFLEQQINKRTKFFGWLYLTLLIWNTATTWWMCNSTVPGGISAILANSLLMSIPWIGFYNVKRRLGERIGYISLIVFWLTFEYIHLNWELSWPWLTLGNVFATHPDWVQWYEYTGTGGGSLWVIVINVLIFILLKKNIQQSVINIKYSIIIFLLLLIPALFSLFLIRNSKELTETGNRNQQTNNIVLVQPNIDPWDEKFVAGSEAIQLQKLIQLSESQIDSETALVVWPETAIPIDINEDSIRQSNFLIPVWDFLKHYPKINLLTGMEGFRLYKEQNKTEYAQKIPNSNKYVDSYNSAVLMDSNQFQVYHKSKLVPGAEKLPSFLHFMDAWFEKFGGTTSGYTSQLDRTVLKTYNKTYSIAPSVCYESIYGEFMSKYISNGANIIAIITNDGWWGNTAGYKQHENYARLRAIETRHWVVRSANTGISCFINPKGDVIIPQPWNKATAIKMNVPLINNPPDFFVKHGDIISKISMVFAIIIIIFNIGNIISKKWGRG
jgi:apolipoprotein N-acyltransferase